MWLAVDVSDLYCYTTSPQYCVRAASTVCKGEVVGTVVEIGVPEIKRALVPKEAN